MAKSVVGLEVKVDGMAKAAGDVGSFRKQLKDATADLVTMSEKFGLSSKEAQNAAKKVAGLKDAIGDAKQLADTFNPDKKFVALGGALQGVTAGFSAFSGAMGVLGADSEKTEKLLLRVQSAMALQQGISGIMGAVDSFKLLSNTVKGSVTKAFGTLKGAIISTGIGILVVGLGLLIANFDSVKKAVLNLIPGLAKVGEFIGKLVDGFTDFIGVTSEAERAQEKFIKSTEESIRRQSDFLDANGDKFDAYTNRKIKADIDYQSKKLELDKDEVRSEAEKQSLLKQYEDKRNREILRAGADRQKVYDDAAQADSDKAVAAFDKKNAALKAAREKAEAAEKERLKGLAALNKSLNTTGDINADLAGMKEGFNAEDQAKIDADKALAEARGNVSAEYFDRLDQQRKTDLEGERAVAEQKRAIQEQNMSLIDSAIGFLSSIAGKNKALQKAAVIAENAMGIAKIVISTNAANAAAIAKYSLIPGGQALSAAEILKNKISAGIGIASTIAATAKALSAIGSGGSGSSGSVGGSSPNAPLTPQAATTTLDQNSINRIGNAANRVFVVESDMTGQQERIRRLNRASRIS